MEHLFVMVVIVLMRYHSIAVWVITWLSGALYMTLVQVPFPKIRNLANFAAFTCFSSLRLVLIGVAVVMLKRETCQNLQMLKGT